MRRFFIFLLFVLGFTFQAEARKLALLVGIDEYDGVPSLRCCVNDVKALKSALLKVGFEEDDIQTLVTGGEYKNLPTKKKIERKLEELFASAGPADLVFISFSGHGAQEGEKVYFCPPDVETDDLDGTCVSITKMMEDLAACKAKFKWVVVDACRNDPTRSAKGIGGKGLQSVPAPPAGIALFQSCAMGEESWEDRASGNGYFTKNFTAALSGEADTDHDGQLTLMEVCKWTTSRTKEQVMTAENKSQRPYFSGSVSDFPLMEDLNVPKAKALAAEAEQAMEAENYALAVEKFDAAIALYSKVDSWKRERDLAKKFLETLASAKKVQATSRASFEWDGTKITKFIGEETEVVIPEGVTEIGKSAFSGCSSLTSVVIPEGVTVIGSSAFDGCSSLTSVVIPESVQEIEWGVFTDCTALKRWSISANHPYFKTDGTGLLTKDGKKLVACLASATEYRIPEGVSEIGSYAFSGCSSLTSVEIPEGVTEIGSRAFDGCSSLTSMVIPDSVQEIDWGVFVGCTALKQWTISADHPYFKTDGTGLLTKDGKKLVACVGTATEYRIPEGVTEIGEEAFRDCSSLTSVVIPEGMTVIGWYAFLDCSSLTSVVIPEGVTKIESFAFYGCRSLTSVVIPEGVTKIESFAFEDCPKLTIHAPKGSKAEEYAKENNIPFEAQ